jgi:hypothetical protein
MTRKKWQQDEYDKADSKIMDYLIGNEGSTIIEIALGVELDRNTVSKHLNAHKGTKLSVTNSQWFLTETLQKAEKKVADMNWNEIKALREALKDTRKKLELVSKKSDEQRALIARGLAEYRADEGKRWHLIPDTTIQPQNSDHSILRTNYRTVKG